MKISFAEIIDVIWNAPTYIDGYLKLKRMQADFNAAIAEWNTIGGFNAPSQTLVQFIEAKALLLVEYASWTPTKIDDYFASIIHCVIADHREIIMHMIEWVRTGHTLTAQELSAITEHVCHVPMDEFGDPVTTLYILTVLYQALQFLRDKQIVPIVLPDTVIIEPPPVKRPVLNFIKTIFGKK